MESSDYTANLMLIQFRLTIDSEQIMIFLTRSGACICGMIRDAGHKVCLTRLSNLSLEVSALSFTMKLPVVA